MKYRIIKNENVKRDELLYDVADFLWNNGNEVLVDENDKEIFQDAAEDFDVLVLFVSSKRSEKNIFERDLDIICKDFGLKDGYQKKTILAFSNNGVFSNMIPFPHLLFHFEKFEKEELVRFFCWCNKFSMFRKNEADKTLFYNVLKGL